MTRGRSVACRLSEMSGSLWTYVSLWCPAICERFLSFESLPTEITVIRFLSSLQMKSNMLRRIRDLLLYTSQNVDAFVSSNSSHQVQTAKQLLKDASKSFLHLLFRFNARVSGFYENSSNIMTCTCLKSLHFEFHRKPSLLKCYERNKRMERSNRSLNAQLSKCERVNVDWGLNKEFWRRLTWNGENDGSTKIEMLKNRRRDRRCLIVISYYMHPGLTLNKTGTEKIESTVVNNFLMESSIKRLKILTRCIHFCFQRLKTRTESTQA